MENEMRVLSLDKYGIKLTKPVKAFHNTRGEYYRFQHGQEGRGRKLIYITLSLRDFPTNIEINEYQEFKLIPVSGNKAYILGKGDIDSEFLLLWYLSPGFRGGAKYEIEGNAKVIMEGYDAQGDAGRMGGDPCPIVHVYGPCVLKWTRSGRLYGDYNKYRAIYNGSDWIVEPDDDLSNAVDAAFDL
jgi:hypothetical protein